MKKPESLRQKHDTYRDNLVSQALTTKQAWDVARAHVTADLRVLEMIDGEFEKLRKCYEAFWEE